MKLAAKFDHLAALRPRPGKRSAEARSDGAGFESHADALMESLGGVHERNRCGECIAIRRWFAEPASCEATAPALRLLAPVKPPPTSAALEEIADPERWLFLDTETTGLAGGTGTYAFLIGLAWWDAGGLQVEQFFMRDFSEEHAVLLAVAERLGARRILITFNGKSFDWPLLETRYRMTRQITACAPRAHLDLLHPARQIWKLRLSSLRLAELERHVLGWDRGSDVLSELIPQIYFDFLRGGNPAPLAAVFRHNQMDLRGLAALAGRIAALLSEQEATETDPPQQSGDALELYGLSRLLHRRGQLPLARRRYEQALDRGLPAMVDRAARGELARMAKRERDFPRAVALWEQLLGHVCLDERRGGALVLSADRDSAFALSLEGYEQLAIYYEHHAHQPDRAAEVTRQALAELQRARQTGHVTSGIHRRWQARVEHRLARLSRKLDLLL